MPAGAPMQFYIETMGLKKVTLNLKQMGTKAARARPAMEKAAAYLFEVESKIFSGQGRRGGGSWPAISAEWEARKVAMGYDSRILFMRHQLRDSMAVPGAANQQLHIGDTRLIIASTLDYAAKQQRTRDFTKLLPQDKAVLRAFIKDHITSVYKARRSRGEA
jgi:hypothetical protein